MILSRAAILAASDIKTETVNVPEWGGAVLVRGMSGTERDAYEQSILVVNSKGRKVDLVGARAKLVVRCIVDEAGHRLFEDGDAPALAAKSAAAIERVFDVASRLSGLSSTDVEDLAKN
jgi:hypothetical protein